MPTAKQLAEAERVRGAVDWSRFDRMSDEEIRAAWAWDKDALRPTEAELKEFSPMDGTAKPAKDAAE